MSRPTCGEWTKQDGPTKRTTPSPHTQQADHHTARHDKQLSCPDTAQCPNTTKLDGLTILERWRKSGKQPRRPLHSSDNTRFRGVDKIWHTATLTVTWLKPHSAAMHMDTSPKVGKSNRAREHPHGYIVRANRRLITEKREGEGMDRRPSCNISNKTLSDPFLLGRGMRQDCPLSPLLFALAIELLAKTIHSHSDIHGYNTEYTKKKISLGQITFCYMSPIPGSFVKLSFSGYKIYWGQKRLLTSARYCSKLAQRAPS